VAVFAGGTGRVIGMHLSTEKVLFDISYPFEANSLCLLDSNRLAVGYENGMVIVWQMKSRYDEILSLNPPQVPCNMTSYF
jgi:hypothetical protein